MALLPVLHHVVRERRDFNQRAVLVRVGARHQGLTLVHFSAQPKPFPTQLTL